MSISETIRTLLVDDEDLARAVVKEHLAPHPEIEVIGECGNGFEAVKMVNELRPDLVFLDIQMPKLDGFEVLELLEHQPAVVFVTAYDEFALRAFEVHAVDYLLKPFRKERFDEALLRVSRRVREGRKGNAEPGLSYRELAGSARPAGSYLERIVIRDGAKLHVVPVEKVDYIAAADDYVSVHVGEKEFLKQQTLSSMEAMLDPRRFVRIHRGSVVNVARILRIEPYSKDSKIVLLSGGVQLPASRAGLAALEAVLGGL
ncbi:MAG: response regulator [Bryobacterales bacterium]|nr:response regulator [Bryobacterales bacterium]